MNNSRRYSRFPDRFNHFIEKPQLSFGIFMIQRILYVGEMGRQPLNFQSFNSGSHANEFRNVAGKKTLSSRTCFDLNMYPAVYSMIQDLLQFFKCFDIVNR